MSDAPRIEDAVDPLQALRYRELFDRVQDIVYVRDLEGVILDINEAGARFFGRSKAEIIGHKLHRSDDDEQARSLKSTNEILFRHGLDRSMVEMQNRAGQTRIVEATTTVMRDAEGRPVGACGVMRDVTEAVHLQRVLAADNIRKTEELEEARFIQLALLPKQLPRVPHAEVAVSMRSASEVGGDYYDFHVAEDRTLTLALGDATGHGLKAAILGATAKSYFQSLADRQAPREMLETMSVALRNLGIPSLYLCLLIMRIHDRQISVVGAGMPAFYLCRRTGGVERIEITGTPLGMRAKPSFEGKVLDFDPGSTLLLFSDGVPELLDVQDRELGEDAVRDCFAAAADLPAHEVLARVLELAEQWSGGRPPADDITVMVVKAK